MKKILIIICLFSVAVASSWTPESTHIMGNVTWPERDVDTILITQDIVIEDNGGLTLLPGNHGDRIVYFSDNHQVIVKGYIHARGREWSNIVFTGNSFVYHKEDFIGWGGLSFDNSGSGTQGKMDDNRQSLFNFCRFNYANTSRDGGAFVIRNFSNILIENSIFQHNKAQNGGALYICNSSPLIKNSQIYNNYADDSGGGFYICNSSAPEIRNTSIRENEASGYGGGFYFDRSAADISNSLIAENKSLRGGGICLYSASINLKNSDVVMNDALIEGDGIYMNNSFTVAANSIFWGNNGDDLQMTGVSDHRFKYTAVEEDEFAVGPGFINLDKKNNGNLGPHFVDPRRGDFNLSEDSPCVDEGYHGVIDNSMLADLSGHERISNYTPDMGAFEFNSQENLNDFVELEDFKLYVKDASIRLKWQTSHESDNAYFYIYRDGQIVASLSGAGNSDQILNYEFTDYVENAGTHNYMLSNVNTMGLEQTHEKYQLSIRLTDDDMQQYAEKIEQKRLAKASSNKSVNIKIYDVKGRHLATVMEGGSKMVDKSTDGLSTGMYLMQIVKDKIK